QRAPPQLARSRGTVEWSLGASLKWSVLEALLLQVKHAFVFEHTGIRVHSFIERHADLPGPGEHLGIFDGSFITQMRSIDRRIALDHMQGIAMKISRVIE